MNLDRRQFLGLGCVAIVAMQSSPAAARTPAPRVACPHSLCRHHRPGDPGFCALSLRGGALPEES